MKRCEDCDGYQEYFHLTRHLEGSSRFLAGFGWTGRTSCSGARGFLRYAQGSDWPEAVSPDDRQPGGRALIAASHRGLFVFAMDWKHPMWRRVVGDWIFATADRREKRSLVLPQHPAVFRIRRSGVGAIGIEQSSQSDIRAFRRIRAKRSVRGR